MKDQVNIIFAQASSHCISKSCNCASLNTETFDFSKRYKLFINYLTICTHKQQKKKKTLTPTKSNENVHSSWKWNQGNCTNTDLAAIFVTYWRRACKRRATGDEAIFRTSVVASSSMLVHSLPGTPAWETEELKTRFLKFPIFPQLVRRSGAHHARPEGQQRQSEEAGHLAVVHAELRGQLQTLLVGHYSLNEEALALVHLSQPLRKRRSGEGRKAEDECRRGEKAK